MKDITYLLNGAEETISVDDSIQIKFGADEVLASKDTDITFNQDWYEKGLAEKDFLNEEEFGSLKAGLTQCIKRLLEEELGANTEGFSLEKYHQYATSDEDHFKIASKTRDLFSKDFNFPILELLPRLGAMLGFELTDIDPKINKKAHIIVRINRPGSNDFNPPHKDIYEGVDNDKYIPQFVNFWIPIAGVTQNSSLPMVPGSHLMNEKEVLRTFSGAGVEGNKYRVRLIESWNGKNELERSTVKYGQALVFSSHIIHGFAKNNEQDTTRVALEFRLFKA